MNETHLNGASMDIVADNVQKLKSIFPEIFCENSIDFEKLQAVLGHYIDTDNERYNFSWWGKSQALRLAQTPSTGTLRPCKEESKDWDTTQNLYIEGDNLEVLKLLQKTYHDKVKIIYIDPPYNTGKDFVYPDNYKDNLQNYKEITGQVDTEGNTIGTNSETSGRYHTNWLNMMYPRLRMARNLLADNGVIYISIDDTEVANMMKICNEVFGEENFVNDIIWHKKYGAANDAKYLSDVHDHILLYCKSKNNWRPNLFERPKELNDKYTNPDNDPRGPWIATNLSVKTYSSANDYIITSPAGLQFSPPPSRCWVVSKERYEEMLADNRITFGKDGKSRPYSKTFLSEVQNGIVPTTLWTYNEAGHNIGAKSELRDLFSETTVPFDTPKPTKLIQRMIKMAESVTKDDIILDFFSGSGTTAEGVLKFNAEDGGKRKFILVQLPEPCKENSEAYKAGYKNICEIGKERIRRAGEKIKTQSIDNIGDTLDIGFKVFKLDTSNIKKWSPDYDNLDQTLFDHINNFVEGRTELDVVYEIMLKYGINLTFPIEEHILCSKKVYSIGFGALIICLDNDITMDLASEIIKLKEELNPDIVRVVFKDNGFKNDSVKTNVKEIFKVNGIDEMVSI